MLFSAHSSAMHNTALAAAADAQGIKRESTPDLTIGVMSIVPVFVYSFCLFVAIACWDLIIRMMMIVLAIIKMMTGSCVNSCFLE